MANATSNGKLICDRKDELRASGVFFGGNPLDFATPVLFLQLSVSAILTSIIQLLFNHRGQSSFFSHMLTGILMGPMIWGDSNPIVRGALTYRSLYINQTLALFGCTLFLFSIGVKTDLSMVKRTGKKAVIIGVLSFLVPITLNTIVAAILKHTVKMHPDIQQSIYFVASFFALNSFHVVVCLLADLNLLNSELGRLATSSSLVSGMFSWCWIIILYTIMQGSIGKQETVIWMFLSLACLLMIIVYILRPVMVMMARHTTEGKSVKEGYISAIFMMVLGCSFVSEVIGQHMIIGPIFLGMAAPGGPPLGSALVNKLDSFVSSVLLPSYFILTGSGISILNVHWQAVIIIQFLSFCNLLAKLLATVLPSLYCKMPPLDAISLGLIMSVQGVTDVMILQHAQNLKLIDSQSFTIMSVSIVFMAGIITPLVKFLYEPSKRYISHKKRSIQHSHPETELRMLAGIYCQYQTPSIINLLELSNPTAKSPICFYVVHLLELIGRSAPLLITHRPGRKNSVQMQGSKHMINAFRLYEEINEGTVVVNLYTAISPFVSMHDEICSLALEKRVSLIVIPFHKQWNTSTEIEVLPRATRSVNQQILQNAPCSVGILVDRGTTTSTNSMSSKSLYNVGLIFVEGPDDREALAYAMRMAEHPNISITVTRLVDSNKKRREGRTNHQELEDERIINDFRIAHAGKQHFVYKEEFVCDSVETVGIIRSMEDCYDLILVGRRHDSNSPLFAGLTEWNEFPELGFVGDMLASSDSGCQVSVLVMQQTLAKSKNTTTDSSVMVDIPHKLTRVWPET
ncbi:cation/H(+) antiporter 15 [Durio zibethinus]|uniref:Cation/H(+) antiporter 15 n=1 Tax=Durio zibethinus TaxID=66656 RepID=A0A6P5XSU7_DURZI|nr:cation/H(+) antiporter 15 [Durio zibethinus]